ncbi:uncharacterized protein LOC114245175 [Bombyx mandarina]|uniref:Uncharacterized protein LOC114245175 n=1 Tax=Bombyx mandarina TaxID=7092 RepID=A0A6J2JUP1_BOMMA|nr:uncharacterized protein LOC114245175 [Bombyx mandarina]
MQTEDCKFVKLIGHLDAVKWLQNPRYYRPSPGYLYLEDWTKNPFTWLHYVESSDGLLVEDEVLLNAYSRCWSIHDVQRYFLGDLHCEKILFTHQYPNLKLPSRLGNTLWKTNTATKVLPKLYLKEFNRSLEVTLKKMVSTKAQMNRLIISDQLINIDCLDYFKRKTFFDYLLKIISFQNELQLVSFENLRCKRLEGVRLVQQLACFNADTLKYLFLWKFVLPNENPLLINYSYLTGSGQYISRPETRRCFIQSLGVMKELRMLALEYSHIADGTGGALISLLPVLKRPNFRLQLICRENHVPGRTNAALGVGGYNIPDTAWRRVSIACPDLYLFMAFDRIWDNDNVRRFLSPSIPLCETHLHIGIHVKLVERKDSDLSCFVRHLAFNYASTLSTLGIHQWRSAIFPLRRIFELMPRLVRFYYLGNVDETDLHKTLNLLACGVCTKLKKISIQIQHEQSMTDHWNKMVLKVIEDYSEIMRLNGIDFCMQIYKH